MAVATPAVFLDKDGTLVRDVPFNDDADLVELLPGVVGGLRRLAEAGYLLVVVTNQSGLARGLMDEGRLADALSRMERLLEMGGVRLDGVYVCPHHPAGTVPRLATTCACRKPLPGMLFRAATEHGIDLRRSWLIGDILDDIEAGNRAGCRTVLLSGAETEWRNGPFRTPDVIVAGFARAARTVLASAETRPQRRCAL